MQFNEADICIMGPIILLVNILWKNKQSSSSDRNAYNGI